MNRHTVWTLIFGVVLGSLLTTAAFIGIIRRDSASSGGTQKTVLKLAHVLDVSHPVHAGMEFMAKRVAELSSGMVEVQLFPNGQLGSEPETIEQAQRGALALVKTSAAAMEGFVPEMAVFGLFYLFKDHDQYWRVLDGPIGKELLDAGDRTGIHGLCYYDSGSRSFYTIKKPVLTPEDLKGMKIRVMPSRMSMDMISGLGGAPTPIPFGELYTALQQGMVDGAENNPPTLLATRHYEVAKHFSIDEHARIPDLLVISQAIWSKLTPQQKAWVEQAAQESSVFQRKLWAEKTAEAYTELEKAGVTIYRPDQSLFSEAARPLTDQFKGTPVGDVARRIREVK